MSDETPNKIISNTLKLNYQYATGNTLSHFFTVLRDEAKLLGKTCPECNEVLFPPKEMCGRCFAMTGDWVELSGEGTLEAFTVVRYEEPYLPLDPPYILGQIRLDGISGGITYPVKGIASDRVEPGMKVKAVFKADREGRLSDIQYFEPM
jgi:uncharacterized OB-fold protein